MVQRLRIGGSRIREPAAGPGARRRAGRQGVVSHNTSFAGNAAHLICGAADHRDANLACAAHVFGSHATGLLSVPAVDRLDDGAVLRKGTRSPAGPRECGLRKPAHPIVNLTNEVQQHCVVSGFTQRLVELNVELSHVRVLAQLRGYLEFLVQPVQPGAVRDGGMFRRQAGRKLVQSGSYRIHLEHLVLRDRPHDQAAPVDTSREVLSFEPEDGLANRCSADSELTSQLFLAKAVTRAQVPGKNGLAQRYVGNVGHRPRAGMRLPQRA